MKKHEGLSPELVDALEQLRSAPDRDPQAAVHGRERFLAEAASLGHAASRQHGNRPSPARRFSLQVAAAALTILVLFFGSTVGTAYASRDALPGEMLYPVKLLGEDVRQELTFEPRAKVTVLMQFAGTRLDEMNALAGRGAAVPAGVQARLEMQIQAALDAAAGLDDAELQSALLDMRARLEAGEQALTPGVGEQVRGMLQARLRLVDEGLADPEGFRYAVRNRLRYGLTRTPGARSTQAPGGNGPGARPTPTASAGEVTPEPQKPDHSPAPTQGGNPQPTPGGQGGGQGSQGGRP
jgi:hypothetical protein